jgi:hypothetical protein
MYNLKSFRVAILLLWISAVAAALLFMISCNAPVPDPNENRCPYEGFECPNAQAALSQDSARIAYLEGQLAMCPGHSEIK